MRLSIRLTTLAITAVALAGALGAQQRPNAHVGARSQPARSQADNRARSAVRPQQYASSRADVRGGGGYASRPDNRGGNVSQPRNDPRAGNGYAARPDIRGGNGNAARPDTRGGNGYQPRNDPRGGNGYASRPDVRGGNGNAARPDTRGGNGYSPRPDVRSGNGYQPRNDPRARNDFQGGDRRNPVAGNGRPLITRGGVYRGAYGGAYGGQRIWRESRFGGGGFYFRSGLPFGWESRIMLNGYFPVSYGGYCDAVPVDYEYLLPPMLPSYDPCFFGDRVVVFDRFSRSIVFVAAL